MNAPQGPRWIFDELPPSGARRGGDPSEHAFRRDLETFVREVIQNANDQSLGRPEISFSVAELSGTELEAFLSRVSWGTLEPHLRAAAATRGGRALKRFLTDFASNRRLLLLRIEDRNTVGLTGDESEGESHFRALCKDTLYSHKRSASAGGSYGLGKSVLWAFSGLSTVLFNSVLHDRQRDRDSPRLIGRTELPSHQVENGWFTGSGWFGQPVRLRAGSERAESLWGATAALQSRDLHLDRPPTSGTSILIIGFREPASDEEVSVTELARRIRRAAARFFWPAMCMESRALRVSIEGEEPIAVEQFEYVRPFVECYRGRGVGASRLIEPGDIVTRTIDVELPARREGGKPMRGQVLLAVRLAPEQGGGEGVGQVAFFRGTGMVVKYWDRSGLAAATRPFHAVLACGEARHPTAPTEADREVERFLRAAEPPGHDDWLTTPELKESYKRGYTKSLEQLKDRVAQELKHLLTPETSHGGIGPERLRKRFPIGTRGGNGSEPSAFHFSQVRAAFADDRWEFQGEVRPVARVRRWHATIQLRELGEDGVVTEDIPIESIAIDSDRSTHRLVDGLATIEVNPGVDCVAFTGRSVSLRSRDDIRGELSLEITGVIEDPS